MPQHIFAAIPGSGEQARLSGMLCRPTVCRQPASGPAGSALMTPRPHGGLTTPTAPSRITSGRDGVGLVAIKHRGDIPRTVSRDR